MNLTETKPAAESPPPGADPRPASFAFSRALAVLGAPGSARAEAIRALRTHVMAQHFDAGRRGLAVCAPSYGVGCSLVAANLAIAASQVGLKTLLIDADLRKSDLGNLIQPNRHVDGLAQCLTSHDEHIGHFICEDVLPDLSVMMSGGAPHNAQELLASARFRDVVEQCLRDFDVTIVDTSPANHCADSRRISSVVGYSLVVAKQNRSRVRDIKTLVSELKGVGVHVIGTVLSED